MSYTKGPWKVSKRRRIIFSENGKEVATAYIRPLPLDYDEEEAASNARLIAAAPTMCARLEMTANLIEEL